MGPVAISQGQIVPLSEQCCSGFGLAFLHYVLWHKGLQQKCNFVNLLATFQVGQ